MKIELRYFTGTGNAWKVLDTCKETFVEAGHQVKISKLNPDECRLDADLIGFAFPVYAFGMPRIVRRYLRALRQFPDKQNVFFIVTPGDVTGAGSTSKKCENILKRKNCNIVYSDVIKMPNNWIPFSQTDSPEENRSLIEKGVERSRSIAKDILDHKISRFDVKHIPGVFRALGNVINTLFRNFGILGLKSMFRVYPSCNGCGICAKACPTGSIKMVKGKPKWSKTCEQCMRCVHICPQESIYQLPAGTKGKRRYMEPDFDPLKM
jgi:ferredoxin